MSSDNPYQAPETEGTPHKQNTTSGGRVMFAVVLGLLALPAAGVAFFCSCLAAASAGADEGSFLVGGICGLIVLGVMLFLVVRVAAGARRK